MGESNVIRFTVAHQDSGTAQLLAEMVTPEHERQIEATTAESGEWSVLAPPRSARNGVAGISDL